MIDDWLANWAYSLAWDAAAIGDWGEVGIWAAEGKWQVKRIMEELDRRE